MRIELTSDCLQSILACLGTCSPINETVFHSGFYWWFVPHHLLTCTSEQGPKQSTLGHLCLSVWVANPMEPRFLSSVLFGLLSVSFEREKGFEPSTASLEGWNSTNWATPASCDEFGTSVTFFYMEEGINPTNTMGSFYQATFLLNASVFIALELNKRLNILWTHF